MINMDITGGTCLGGLGWVPSSAFHAVVKTRNKPTAENGFSQYWHNFGSLGASAPFSCAQLMALLQSQEWNFYHSAACVVTAQGKMSEKHLGNCLDNVSFRSAEWIHLRAVQDGTGCPCPWDLWGLQRG